MDCARVAREEIVERYVVGGLSDEDRSAFEEHYFECARCFEELEALQAIQAELRRPGAEQRAQHQTLVPSLGSRCRTGGRHRARGRRGGVDASIAAVPSTRTNHHRATVARPDVRNAAAASAAGGRSDA